MRFFVMLLGAVLLVSMAACSSGVIPPKNPLDEQSGNFDTIANISYKELSASARITRENPRSCSVTFTSPESLADIAFVFWGDKVDVNYKALSFTFDPNSVPGGAVASITAGAINAALSGRGLEVDYIDGALTLSGTLDSGDFSLRVDQNDGNLLMLSIPEQRLEVEFVNFTFLN
jgi:hypothetical protein